MSRVDVRVLAAVVGVLALIVVGIAVVALVHRSGGEGGQVSGRAASPRPTDKVASGPPALFGPATSAGATQSPDVSLGTPQRTRYATLRDNVLPQTAAGQQITLGFFDDAVYVGTIARVDRQDLLTAWSGPLDQPNSDFVITLAGGRYQVTASTPQGTFTMSQTRAGLYQLAEVGRQLPIDSGPAQPAPTVGAG